MVHRYLKSMPGVNAYVPAWNGLSDNQGGIFLHCVVVVILRENKAQRFPVSLRPSNIFLKFKTAAMSLFHNFEQFTFMHLRRIRNVVIKAFYVFKPTRITYLNHPWQTTVGATVLLCGLGLGTVLNFSSACSHSGQKDEVLNLSMRKTGNPFLFNIRIRPLFLVGSWNFAFGTDQFPITNIDPSLNFLLSLLT